MQEVILDNTYQCESFACILMIEQTWAIKNYLKRIKQENKRDRQIDR